MYGRNKEGQGRLMCCGKMIRLPNERKRTILTTKDINIDLDKTGGTNDNNKANKRRFSQRKT